MTLEETFAYYTECVLAAVEYQSSLRSVPKAVASHTKMIADGMVTECREREISWKQPGGHGCPRLRRLLETSKRQTMTHQDMAAAWVAEQHATATAAATARGHGVRCGIVTGDSCDCLLTLLADLALKAWEVTEIEKSLALRADEDGDVLLPVPVGLLDEVRRLAHKGMALTSKTDSATGGPSA